MTSNFPLLRHTLIVFLALLTSCTTAPTEPVATATSPVTETVTPLPTFTPPPFIAFPTLPDLPPVTAMPTQTPLPAELPKFPLDGYVMLFTKGGDLYFQDGENTPVKLTDFEDKTDHPPYITLISDDNQKVVVIRKNDSNVYSINTNGTQEQIIISNDKMSAFGSGMKIGALRFVPRTHQLFFIAIHCEAHDGSPCPTSAFLANVDTGEITKLADLGLLLTNPDFGEAGLGSLFANPYIGEYRNIKISPDGKMLAVGSSEGMDIFTLGGNLIRDNILPFIPSTNSLIYPSLFWLSDSSGLIAALPDTTYYTVGHGYLPAHTIWRCTIESNVTTKIPLVPPPWMNAFDVSPDGNWIAYGGYSDPTLYLGNSANGHTQKFGEDSTHPNFSWNSSSQHLIIRSRILVSLDKPLVYGGASPWWIDAVHFVYFDLPINNPSIQKERFLIGEIRGDEIYYYDLGIPYMDLITLKPRQ